MRFHSPVDDGKVLCGLQGVWVDIETCFHCASFAKVKRSDGHEHVVCKTTVDRGLWSPTQRPSRLRV
jgi:hypothetical protein